MFKPPSLWCFVAAALGTWYMGHIVLRCLSSLPLFWEISLPPHLPQSSHVEQYDPNPAWNSLGTCIWDQETSIQWLKLKNIKLGNGQKLCFPHKGKASLPQDKAGTQRSRDGAGRTGGFPVLALSVPQAPALSGPGCDLNSRRMQWLSGNLLFLLKLIYIRFVALVTQTSS